MHSVGQIEQGVAPVCYLQRLAAPGDLTRVYGKKSGDCFQYRRLPCAVWADDAEDLASPNRERHAFNRELIFSVALRQVHNAQQRRGAVRKELVGGHAASLHENGRDAWACRLMGRSLSPTQRLCQRPLPCQSELTPTVAGTRASSPRF